MPEGFTELLRFRVPRKWKRRLVELAAEQGVSVADLCRIFLRAGLYKGKD